MPEMIEAYNTENLDNREFAKRLEQRTKKFAVLILRLAASFPKTSEAKVICHQIVKSGTSVGANYREANRSVSKADFKNKISICTKEASETQYWLELIIETNMASENKVSKLHKECSELLALFTSIHQGCKKKVPEV